MTDFLKILPRGKANAIKAEDLKQRLGYHSTRALRADISECREAGCIICSSSAGGYYLPGTREELTEFRNFMEKRGRSAFKAAAAARRELDQLEGQQHIGGMLTGNSDGCQGTGKAAHAYTGAETWKMKK